ncbi:MAG: GNAT family N-acetyltransferase, partial [Francisellaceae bacterium]|nr:GNAT family N-acetyltransferase [Francisellaceae bacterium]
MGFSLETERLKLTVPTEKDFDDLFSLRTDVDVMSCVGGFGQEFGVSVEIQTEEQVREQISLSEDYFNTYKLGFFCVFLKETGEFLGQAGLFHVKFNVNQPKIELAYRFLKKYWGRGYATEAAKRLIEYGFSGLDLKEMIAPVHPGNERSINVLKKIGMTSQGEMEFRGHQVPYYKITCEHQ